MKKNEFVVKRSLTATLVGLAAIGLTACGSDDPAPADTSATVTGTVVAAPVSGAQCRVLDRNGNALSSTVTTGTDGSYSASIDNADLSSDLVLTCSGGSYTDEATGSKVTAGTLSAFVAGGSLGAGGSIHATPASTIVQRLVTEHNMTLTEAEQSFSSAFGFTPDISIEPADATAGPGSTDDESLAGLRAAAFSQLTLDLGLTEAQQFDLLVALASDLSDGAMDGEQVGTPVTITGSNLLPADIQSMFGSAILNFQSSPNDKSGLLPSKIGTLPLATTVLTDQYKFEYELVSMMSAQGRTDFQIKLSDSSDQAVAGATLELTPMMHMDGYSHSSPNEGCAESSTAGTYDCRVYYLMPSMMAGTPMGYWELTLTANDTDEAKFYPPVMMAMGDTARADLRNENDTITDMTGAVSPRRYILFKSDLTAGMNSTYSFDLYVSVMKSMMSYPGVVKGMDIDAMNVGSIEVSVSVDGTNWVVADGSSDDGHWIASGLTGLSAGVASTIYVKMSINGNQYTASATGTVAGDLTDYAQFTVTPGGGMSM